MASFEQGKNKTWSVRFRIMTDRGLVNKRLSGYPTKKEANQAYVDFMATYAPPLIGSENAKLTMNEMYKYYIDYSASRVKISTMYTMQHDYEKHIEPFFGNKIVKDITKIDVYNWQSQLNKQNYSYKYKTKLRGFLSALFAYAIRYFDLPVNPVSKVEPFKRVNEAKREMHVWTIQEFNQFISVVDDPTYRAFFTFLFYTGCRKSEAFSLNWNDINFKTGKVTINKTLTRKTNKAPYEILSTPKSISGNRTILMPDNLIKELLAYRDLCDTLSPFVFGGDTPLAEHTVSRKLQRYIQAAGVPPIHEHEFRHSHASVLISQGATIVAVSKRLGHSDIEQTLNTYSHMMPDDEEKIVQLLQ